MSSKFTSQRLSEAQAYVAAWRRAEPPLEAKESTQLAEELERRITRHIAKKCLDTDTFF